MFNVVKGSILTYAVKLKTKKGFGILVGGIFETAFRCSYREMIITTKQYEYKM